MKISKIMIFMGLVGIFNMCLPGIFFNNVPITISSEWEKNPKNDSTSSTGIKYWDFFTFTLKGTNDINDYPTFKKIEYNWFRRPVKLVEQKGDYPTLTSIFITDDSFKFSSKPEMINKYFTAIDNLQISRPFYEPMKSIEEYVTQEKNRLKKAVQTLLTNVQKSVIDFGTGFAWISDIFNKPQNLYGLFREIT